MRKLAPQLLPQSRPCNAGTVDTGAGRRLQAGFRSALLDCSGLSQHMGLADSLKRMTYKVHLAAVHDYDPQDAEGFTSLLAIAAEQFPGKRECADLFGVAHSTFYRWKLGEVVPHALVRGAVRERLLDRMTGGDDEADEGPSPPTDRSGGLSIN